jgi:hypothetical protein
MDNFAVQHEPEEGIIRVHLQGRIDDRMLSMATSKLMEEMSHCNCNRFLMDHREVKLSMSIVDLFYLPMVASKIGVPRSSRIAVVYSTQEDDYRFIENVGRNRGFNVRVFTDVDEGIKWLKM